MLSLLIVPIIGYGQGEQLYTDGSATDQDGNTFEWINYGDLDWAIEDAKVKSYRDGAPIQTVISKRDWFNIGYENEIGLYCHYDNDSNNPILYNFFAVVGKNDSDSSTPFKEFAPEGWRVATDEDWTNLENFLISNSYNFDGSSIDNYLSQSMASNFNWFKSYSEGCPGYDLNTNNKSGFNIYPNGFRAGISGDFLNINSYSKIWTFTAVGSYYGYIRQFESFDSSVGRHLNGKNQGCSVRFVRDASTASTKDYSKPVAIYPNPTTSIVTIEGDALYEIEVYSLQGRKLMTHRGNRIDLSALSNTMYIIEATNTSNNQKQIFKVIKE